MPRRRLLVKRARRDPFCLLEFSLRGAEQKLKPGTSPVAELDRMNV